MKQTTLETIRTLSESDHKTLSQKALKTSEETGELARAVLPFEGAHCTTHRFVDREAVLEEVVDVLLCARSIAYDMGFSDDDIDDMAVRKTRKWAELQLKEREADYPVPYEIHITVKSPNISTFQKACSSAGVKAIVLDLQKADGENLMTDVMTSSVYMGDNPGAYAEMERISAVMESFGMEVVRKKIETVPWHPAAPSTLSSHFSMPPNCYFETHFAVICTEEARPRLQALAEELNCHISRNIFKRIDGETFKIMLTHRDYENPRDLFETDVSLIEEGIRANGFELGKTIVEFSVYDTKVSHDSTWISGGK